MKALLSPAKNPLVTIKWLVKFHPRHPIYSGITNKSDLYGRLAYSQFSCQGLSHRYPRVPVPLENRLHPLKLPYCEGRSFAAVSLFSLFGSGWDPSYVSWFCETSFICSEVFSRVFYVKLWSIVRSLCSRCQNTMHVRFFHRVYGQSFFNTNNLFIVLSSSYESAPPSRVREAKRAWPRSGRKILPSLIPPAYAISFAPV